jgi:PAS domain S-box-containing protein
MFVALLAALLAALIAGALVLRRSGPVPWLGAWIVLAAIGIADALAAEYPLLRPPAQALSALFPVLLVSGALRYCERPVPGWILAAGLLLAALRGGLTAADAWGPVHTLTLILGPPLAFTAAWIVHRYDGAAQRGISHALIVPGLLVLGGLELYTLSSDLFGVPESRGVLAWLALSIPIAGTQIASSLDRARQRERDRSKELEESHRRFESLASSSDDLIFELAGDGAVLYASPPWAAKACVDEDGAPLSSPLARVHPDDSEYVRRCAQELQASGRLRMRPIRSQTIGGDWAWFEITARLHERSDGSVSTLSIARDVTDNVDAERALATTEERLRAVLTSLGPIRAVVLDEEGCVVSIFGNNPEEREQRYGFRRADAIRMRIVDFLPGDESDEVLEQVRRVFKTGEPGELAIRVELPNGPFHFAAALQPLSDGWGRTEGVLAVVRDVSEEIRADEQRKALEARLRSTERFDSLAILAGGIAHDFNNLLVGVAGNAELLLDDPGRSEASTPLIDEILSASERASRLTSQLLAFAGRQEFEPSALELNDLVAETADLVRSSFPEEVSLVWSPSSAQHWIDGDAESLRRMLVQLVTNAREASRAGDAVTVRTGAVMLDAEALAAWAAPAPLEPGVFAYVEVGDEGPGIAEEDRDRIFEPFYSTKFQGRGLGLASALGIARRHGGAIEVGSAEGGGARLRCYLPLADAVTDAEEAIGEDSDWQPRGTVLVAEEQSLVRKVARRMLERLGFDVLVARDGDEALGLLQMHQDAIVCVLLDATMSGGPAGEMVRGLRQIDSEVPIVLTSGRHQHDARRLVEPLRTAWLDKPFRASALRAALASVLDERRAGRDPSG